MLERLLVGVAFAFAVAAVFAAVAGRRVVLPTRSRASPSARLIDPVNGNQGGVADATSTASSDMACSSRSAATRGCCAALAGDVRAGPDRPRPAADARSSAAPSRRCSATVFIGAVEVAAPVLLALVVTDIAFGMVAAVVPQLNVFAVGFPVKVGVALLIVHGVAAVPRRLAHRPARGVGRRRPALAAGRPVLMPATTTRQRSRHPSAAARRARRGRSPRAPTSTAPVVLIAGLDRADHHVGAAIVNAAGARRCADAFARIAAPGDGRQRRRAQRAASSEIAHAAAHHGRADRRGLPRGRRVPQRRAGRLRPSLHALKPDSRSSTRSPASSNLFGPQSTLRHCQVADEGRGRRRASSRWRCMPEITHLGAERRHAAGGARRADRASVSGDRGARRGRLSADRVDRLRLAAAALREVAEDDQAGGQGGGAPARDLPPEVRSAHAPPPDPGRARADDGGGVRRRTSSSRTRPTSPSRSATTARKPRRTSSPRARTWWPRRSAEIAEEHDVPIVPDPPLARELHRTVEIGQIDPGGAVRGGRPGARVRLPARGRRQASAHERRPASARLLRAHRPARRGRRRASVVTMLVDPAAVGAARHASSR